MELVVPLAGVDVTGAGQVSLAKPRQQVIGNRDGALLTGLGDMLGNDYHLALQVHRLPGQTSALRGTHTGKGTDAEIRNKLGDRPPLAAWSFVRPSRTWETISC